jgi:hypothetical protein
VAYATRTSLPSFASPTFKTSLSLLTSNTNQKGNGTTASPSAPTSRFRLLRIWASLPKQASLQITTTSSRLKPRTYTRQQADPRSLVRTKDASGAHLQGRRTAVVLLRGYGPSSSSVSLALRLFSPTLALRPGDHHAVDHDFEKANADMSENTSYLLF